MSQHRILVVEDDELVAQDIRLQLQHIGYDVPPPVATGEEALARIAAERPDLVLMDIVLEGELSGIAAAGRIREQFRIPVIYLTAYSDEEMIDKAKITEPFGYIVKPFTPRELHAAISIALYKAGLEQQLEQAAWTTASLMSLCDSILTTDIDGRVNFINQAAQHLLKLPDDAAGPLESLVTLRTDAGPVDLSALHAQALREGCVVRFEDGLSLRISDGQWLPVMMGVAPIRGHLDKAVGTVLILHDDSDRQHMQQALRESEQKFRTLAETTDCAIFVYREKMLYFNPKAMMLSGYSAEELSGMALLDLVHPDHREMIAQRLRDRIAGDAAPQHYEIKIVTRSGTSCWVNIAAGMTQYEGAPAGVATAFDISAAKQADERLRHKNRALQTLSACNEVLVRTDDEQILLNEICRIIVETGEYRLAWVGFIGAEDTHEVVPVAQYGDTTGYLKRAAISWSDDEAGRGPTGTAIRTGSVRVVQNLQTDEQYRPWRDLAAESGFASAIALPMKVSDRVIGAVNIYAGEANAFDNEEIRLLEELANDLAYGIGSLRARIERQLSMNAHRDAEQRYRQLIEMSFDMIATIQDGVIVEINPSGVALLGVDSMEAALGSQYTDFVHPEHVEAVRASLLRISGHLQAAERMEARFIHPDGNDPDVEIVSYPVAWGGQSAVLIVVRDITAIKRSDAERARRQTGQSKLDYWVRMLISSAGNRQMFYDNVCAGIVDLVDADIGCLPLLNADRKSFTYVSAAGGAADKVRGMSMPLHAGGLCGWVAEHHEALTVPDFSTDHRVIPTLVDALDVNTGTLVPINYEDKCIGGLSAFRKGKPFDAIDEELLTLFSQRVAIAMGNLNLLITLEQRVAERTADLAAINEELEAFAYSVSHDLRAPLRSIDGFSHALLEDYHDKIAPEGQAMLNRVRAASQRMGRLIDDMLTLSRVTRAKMKHDKVDLSALAYKVTRTLRQSEPKRQVEILIKPGMTAHGDPRLLEVVMENLLGNAWKFTSKRSEAVIEFGETRTEEGHVFFVRDNGAGFDDEYNHKLFGTFQRLHSPQEFEGTGVGLATVQRIIRRHKGRVWGKGEIDKGATFYFTL